MIISCEEAAEAIASGHIIAIPTDTVYGLACSPYNRAAIDRIYAIKGRPSTLELTVMGSAYTALKDIVVTNDVSDRIANACLPGPVSLVLTTHNRLPGFVLPLQGTTLAVRVPQHEAIFDLCSRVGLLATTSANRHGYPPAVSPAEVETYMGSDVDGILEGTCAFGMPSTIIDCTCMPVRFLRSGPISQEYIEALLSQEGEKVTSILDSPKESKDVSG